MRPCVWQLTTQEASRTSCQVLRPRATRGRTAQCHLQMRRTQTTGLFCSCCLLRLCTMCLVALFGFVTDAFASRGHPLNIGPAKTAALIARRGEGEKAARHEARRAHDGHMHSTTQLLGAVRAPIVHNYVHPGSAFDARGPMAPEIKHRASTTAAPLQVLRGRVFATDALEALERLTLADSLALSGRL